MDLVFEIDKAFIADAIESGKISRMGMRPSPTLLAFLLGEVAEVFHVDVEEPRSYFVNRLHHIRSRAHGMAHIDAAAMRGSVPLSDLRMSSGEGQSLSSGP